MVSEECDLLVVVSGNITTKVSVIRLKLNQAPKLSVQEGYSDLGAISRTICEEGVSISLWLKRRTS